VLILQTDLITEIRCARVVEELVGPCHADTVFVIDTSVHGEWPVAGGVRADGRPRLQHVDGR